MRRHGFVIGVNEAKKAESVRLHAAVCMPCQAPLATRKAGEWWAEMDEVFHLE